MRKIKKTILGVESLESKLALSSASVVQRPWAPTAAAQVRVVDNRPVLNTPSFVGTYQGAGSLGGINVSGRENLLPIVVVCTGRGGSITGTVNDPAVVFRSVRNPSGGTTIYLGGSPSAVNRNLKNLTYRGNESRINVGLFICNTTSCTKYADVYVPIRRF